MTEATATQIDTIKDAVRADLPELSLIKDVDLAERVVTAWAMALADTEYRSISDIPPEGNPGEFILQRGTQAHHMRGTATLALAMADDLEKMMGEFGIDRDILVAGALVHDVGKAYEFSPRNRKRWESDIGRFGMPAVRHPIYGVYYAVAAGLPEEVVHIVAVHSMEREGSFVAASKEAMLVQYADVAFWRVLARAGIVTNATL